MEKSVTLLIVCLSLYARSVYAAPEEAEMVWLTDVTRRLPTVKRESSDPSLPDNLTFQLRGGSRSLTLNLKRNHHINPNADVYFVRNLNDLESHLEKAINMENEDVAYYQDWQNGAFMTVRCVRRSDGQCNRVINGNVLIEERNYDLQPAKTDITSRGFLADVPYLGSLYILRDQRNVQRTLSVTLEDEATVSADKVEQEVKRRLRWNPEGERLSHIQDSMLPSRNGKPLYNRDNLKQVYYVELDVMLDSSVWDYYSSLWQTNRGPVQPDKVVKKLRQLFCHIINGVDLRYQGIDDPSIDISVTLRKFYILQKLEQFNHNRSKVESAPGTDRIDVSKYLKDLSIWTYRYAKRSDHVMLFTKYEIYGDDPDEDLNGLTNFDDICDRYYKTSIIQSRDYLFTTLTAAHELGHSLGAFHDGEDEATACKAEDFFLMSSMDPVFDVNSEYSRNPWVFSNCSLDAFKQLAHKNKTCLNNVGTPYDEEEWKTFMTLQPGQEYSYNEQCEFAHGHGSKLCGGVHPNICLFMTCTDPITQECLPEYIRAARGTRCGTTMWCIEGMCVSKY